MGERQPRRFTCTYSGAENTSKKTLIFAQNPENKGPEFFLPARSMVLKVVRGKILETLGLAPFAVACDSVPGTAGNAASAFSPWLRSVALGGRARRMVRLSKIDIIL